MKNEECNHEGHEGHEGRNGMPGEGDLFLEEVTSSEKKIEKTDESSDSIFVLFVTFVVAFFFPFDFVVAFFCWPTGRSRSGG